MAKKMKVLNSNLHNAKADKNDEFYTQISDIEKEMSHYKSYFKGKTVFCNCDDPIESNFWKYFDLKFDQLGLKKLITTHYVKEGSSYKLEKINSSEIIKTPLNGNGDFRSDECVEILRESDIVVTNPPFSLFRDYIGQLVKEDKKFIVIGNQNAITYKEIFNLIANNKIWLGYKNGDMSFKVPKDSEPRETRFWTDNNGQKWRSLGNACWFTNLEHNKRNEDIVLYKEYIEEFYPKYDNHQAIEISKVAEIPINYNKPMGVPITFLDKYNPKQFDIVGFRKGDDGKDLKVNGKDLYARIIIKRKEML